MTDDQVSPHTNRLRALREAQGLTREQLAARTVAISKQSGSEYRAISRSALRMLEAGLSRPRLATARALAQALAHAPEDIFTSGYDSADRRSKIDVFLSHRVLSSEDVAAFRLQLSRLMDELHEEAFFVYLDSNAHDFPDVELPDGIQPLDALLPDRKVGIRCCRPATDSEAPDNILQIERFASGWHRVSLSPEILGDNINAVLGLWLSTLFANPPTQPDLRLTQRRTAGKNSSHPEVSV